MGIKMRKDALAALAVMIVLLLAGICYAGFWKVPSAAPIDGVVVDSVTNAPIEGAVVDLTGNEHTGVLQTSRMPVEETVTDAQGRFHLVGYKGKVMEPDISLAIYKQGYACWGRNSVYNGTAWGKYHAEDWTWRTGYVYRMDKFNPEWSHMEHVSFIRGALGQSDPGPKFDAATRWELHMAGEEMRKKGGY